MAKVPEFTTREMYDLISRWWWTAPAPLRAPGHGVRKSAHMRELIRCEDAWGWPIAEDHLGEELHSWVYFARDCTGAVKIGLSRNPEERMKRIGGACKLLILVRGGRRSHERSLHRLFAPECTTGEWFQGDLVESLVSFLVSAASKASAA